MESTANTISRALFSPVRRLVFGFGLLSAVATSVAATQPDASEPQLNWYQVDVLVFRNLASNSTEAWSPLTVEETSHSAIRLTSLQGAEAETPDTPLIYREGAAPNDDNYLITRSPAKATAMETRYRPYISLPVSERQLNQAADRLANSGSYSLLGRYAWRVALKEQGESLPVLLEGGQTFGSKPELRGTIKVSNKRYLHVDADFWYRQFETSRNDSSAPGVVTFNSATANQNDEIGLVPGKQLEEVTTDGYRLTRHFHIKGSQRVLRTSEVTYFDSPVFGVLVKLTPWEIPLSEIPVDDRTDKLLEQSGINTPS